MKLHKLKIIITAAAVLVCGPLCVAAPAAALSSSGMVVADFNSDACKGVTDVAGGSCGSSGASQINTAIKAAINILSTIVGVAALIVIIISGLRFITSSGDTSAVASARSGLIYALVGLALAAVAQFLVHFVFEKV